MITKSIKQQPELHIAHQSELIDLQKQLNLMKQQIKLLTSKLMSTDVAHVKSNISLTIKLPTKNGIEWLATNQIIYCQAQGNYCKIYTQDSCNENNTKTFVVSKSLKKFSTQLSSSNFIRCHQSYLINRNHVVRSTSKGGFQLIMRNNKSIPVSRRRKHMMTSIFH